MTINAERKPVEATEDKQTPEELLRGLTDMAVESLLRRSENNAAPADADRQLRWRRELMSRELMEIRADVLRLSSEVKELQQQLGLGLPLTTNTTTSAASNGADSKGSESVNSSDPMAIRFSQLPPPQPLPRSYYPLVIAAGVIFLGATGFGIVWAWHGHREQKPAVKQAIPQTVVPQIVRPDPPAPKPNLPASSAATADRPPAAAAEVLRQALELIELQRWTEAESELQTVLQQFPENTKARFCLASVVENQGRAAEAVALYRQVLREKPDSAIAANNLAELLATHPDAKLRNGAEALDLAENNIARYHDQVPLFVDTLAAAYAEVGRYDEAVTTARHARELAEKAGDDKLVQSISARLSCYESRQPARSDALYQSPQLSLGRR